MLRRQYEIHHSYSTDDLQNVRVEKGILGKTLVIMLQDNTVCRYEGIDNVDEWHTQLTELIMGLSKSYLMERNVIALLKSRERTSFDEIWKISQTYWPTEGEVDDEIVTRWLEDYIDEGKIEGFIERS